MKNITQSKDKANTFRKQGLLEEALSIYEGLWENTATRDKFDAAGYLHCLRKLKMYEEAEKLAEELEELYADFNWCRIEIIWTYIGKLKQAKENDSLASILPTANRIMNLNPDDLQRNTTVLSVLKKAKQFKMWNIACQWVDYVDPETLDKEPINLQKGTTPWSNYLIWYHHKVRCLIHQDKYKEAIDMIDGIISEAKQVSKYFRCLEAHAHEKLGQADRAIEIFEMLCNHNRVDWWVIHQYATVLKNKGEKEQALNKMYKAASLAFKMESIVTLLYDIALLCKELNRMEESYYHFLLLKLIREKKEWAVKEEIEKFVEYLGSTLDISGKLNYKDVLHQCREYWGVKTIVKVRNPRNENEGNRKLKKALNGYLVQVKEDKPFCFIKTSEESFFCYKSDIKGEVIDGLKVKFDVIPSFDKKKQQESWKAINIVIN